jgi:hypothetical protein
LFKAAGIKPLNTNQKIDPGPQGIDSIYLNQWLENDFKRSFFEINTATRDIFSALS